MLNKPQIKQNTPLKKWFSSTGNPPPYSQTKQINAYVSITVCPHHLLHVFILVYFVFAHLNYANPPGLSLTQTDLEAYLVNSQVTQEWPDGEMSTTMGKSKPKQYVAWPSSSEEVTVYSWPVFYFLIASWKTMWQSKMETETRK